MLPPAYRPASPPLEKCPRIVRGKLCLEAGCSSACDNVNLPSPLISNVDAGTTVRKEFSLPSARRRYTTTPGKRRVFRCFATSYRRTGAAQYAAENYDRFPMTCPVASAFGHVSLNVQAE